MTAWNTIENIINDDPNVMIRLEPIAYSMNTNLSITISLIDPKTFRPLYNIRRIIDYNEMKDKTNKFFGETKYEDIIGNLIERMYLDLKTKKKEIECMYLELKSKKEETE